MHNSPSGTFTVNLKSGLDIITSKSFSSDDIKTSLDTTDSYAHVFYPVVFDENVILKKGSYDIELTASGYTFSDSAYIGWVREYPEYNNSESEDLIKLDYPLGFRIISNDNRELI